MRALEPRNTVAAAWLDALELVAAAPSGRVQHLVLTVLQPTSELDLVLAQALDEFTAPHHSVQTVANTLFPSSIYEDPRVTWSPELDAADELLLDRAAADLFEAYSLMLPLIRSAETGNAQGTYFSRMMSWPGREPGGYNQLAARIMQLRSQRRRVTTFNSADIVIEGAGDAQDVGGVEIYKVDDERIIGFPCLVHIDLSVLNGRLSMLAVYRHWHMIRKAYGNLLGLAAVQNFLAQQAGFEVGELVVHGTVANAELDDFSATKVRGLAARLAEMSSSAAGTG